MAPNAHSPAEVVAALQTILVVDKLPIGFLIGAGCPSSIKVADSPFIPDARGLTDAVVNASSGTDLAESFQRLKSMLVDDGQQNPTIEHMLTRARAMEAVVGNDVVRGFCRSDLQHLEQEICGTISRVVNKPLPSSTTPYHNLARWIGQRTNRSFIFTTNYDLLVEQALEALQVPFFDGFVGSYQPFFSQQAIEQDDFPDQWALVCKLHGSINWRLMGQRNIVRSLDGAGDQLLIHPSHLKYAESRRMPYFVMLDRLKAFIGNERKPAALFTIGYSFSDEHINDTIADSLRANPSAVCYAFQYDVLSEYPQVKNLVQRCSNLNVLALDKAVVDGRESRWATCSVGQVEELGSAFRPLRSQDDSSAPGSNGLSPSCLAGENAEDKDDDEISVKCRLGDFECLGHFLASFSPAKRGGEVESTP